jgi:hypothetical protein
MLHHPGLMPVDIYQTSAFAERVRHEPDLRKQFQRMVHPSYPIKTLPAGKTFEDSPIENLLPTIPARSRFVPPRIEREWEPWN